MTELFYFLVGMLAGVLFNWVLFLIIVVGYLEKHQRGDPDHDE